MGVVIFFMQASVVDLRYKTKEILESLRRRQKVELTCRGKIEGIILPAPLNSDRQPLSSHPAIGMWKDQEEPVSDLVRRLRKPRVHAG
jgi:hypothetical protein